MTEPLRLIALTGRAGAGKDSVAATLVRHRNYRSIAFADALRAEIAECWRIDPRMLQDPGTKEWPIPALAASNCGDPRFVWHAARREHSLTEPRSPRWVMQQWGDFVRGLHGDGHYAEIVRRWIKRQYGSGWTRIVVTDLRFLTELAALRMTDLRALRVVRVRRPSLPPPVDAHPSETQLRHVEADDELINDGTPADLVSATLRLEAGLWGSEKFQEQK